MDVLHVDLGFAEECDPHLLTNRFFPSKIGGKPAWLELKNLPKPEDLFCAGCERQLVFLCQIYAPIEDDPECFHRTIYIFICKSEGCFTPNSAQNIVALRSQIRRENKYYPAIPPDEEREMSAIAPLANLCNVCGCLGPLVCSRCKLTFYCGKIHQRIDWTHGHKLTCEGNASNYASSSILLFPEFNIVIEPETENESLVSSSEIEDLDKRRLAEYEDFIKDRNSGSLTDMPESELEEYAANSNDDKTFRKFKKIVASSPEQVLRYQRGGTFLAIREPVTQDQSVPCCETCKSSRIFEFQIMPQCLNFLKNSVMDWGTIVVYTCKNSCDPKEGYVKEYVEKQDVI